MSKFVDEQHTRNKAEALERAEQLSDLYRDVKPIPYKSLLDDYWCTPEEAMQIRREGKYYPGICY